MIHQFPLSEEQFDQDNSSTIVHYGDTVDFQFGYISSTITKDQLEEMLRGGVLYIDGDEYAVLVRIEKGGD